MNELHSKMERLKAEKEKQIKLLDDAMSQELQRVMQHMGQSLTTISGKFTDDYQRLVVAMNDVVKRGQGVS